MQDVEERIKTLIVNKLGVELQVNADEITPETPLVEGGLNLDSVNLLELIVLIEKEFGVTIEDEDLSIDLIRNIGSLAGYMRERLGSGSSR